MRLTVLGSSGSSPARGNPGSGYLLRHDRTTIWIDAGPGTLMRLLDEIDPRDLSAIVLTHTHLDHSTDFLGFFHYVAYGPGEPGLRVFAPQGAAEHFGRYVATTSAHPFWDAFDFVTCVDGLDSVVGTMSLRFAEANHSVPAIALRVEAERRVLVYTGDTGPSEGVEVLASEADVFLCEASLQGSRDATTYPYHLTAREAAALAGRARVGRLILTHVPPTLNPERSVREAAAVWGRTPELAVPGMVLDV